MSAERFETVWRPKVDGALNLHELTRDHDLAAFILYSSLAGRVGNAGQANYAAANTFLDALADHRHSLGLPATSIAWGLWGETGGAAGGMAAALDRRKLDQVGRSGLHPLSADEGLGLLDDALAAGRSAVVAARFASDMLLTQATAGTLPPQLRGLVTVPVRTETAASPAVPLSERLAGLAEAEQRQMVLDLVRSTLAGVLGYSGGEQIDPERSFKDVGVDSFAAVELRNRLGTATGLQLRASLAFDYPSPQALAEHVYSMVEPQERPEPLLLELDRIESFLAAAPADEDLHQVTTARLEKMLAQWRGRFAGTAAGENDDELDRIQSASAAEILDLIDHEFGRS
jgi:acyl carrier protein